LCKDIDFRGMYFIGSVWVIDAVIQYHFIKPLKVSGNYMYLQVQHLELCILPTHCSCEFHILLTVNGPYLVVGLIQAHFVLCEVRTESFVAI
jgi:hypothetical protein